MTETAMEIARREAEEAEATEAENEDAPEPEPEPDPGPEPQELASGEVDVEAIEKENVRHLKALERIMGEQVAQLQPCETCSTWPFPGFTPFHAPPPLRDAKDAELCVECNGHGVVRSGSLHPDFNVKSCIFCNGKGYRDVVMQEATPLAVAPYTPPAPVEPWPEHYMPFVPLPGGAADNWNRPAGHPRWGLDPLAVLAGGV